MKCFCLCCVWFGMVALRYITFGWKYIYIGSLLYRKIREVEERGPRGRAAKEDWGRGAGAFFCLPFTHLPFTLLRVEDEEERRSRR
ncbi:uncharacterized protein GGS25DRAFT_469127 [Hypoxylon fragiforme]|uniref:uncharacterized protein n=1 Tax=Hypoxylon fragiforme TaxID=63214 RepID=UPI0020C71AD4|nr:uncharacterized protein GGS25DRAFT_469127 [Hypoxylon fragiforme]KAI2613833.1 hypothetical protein GGS25DRAFT_469127 [Hypoxylon fragiforme]